MLCEQCGQYEAEAFVAHARDCADGSQSSRAWNLCRGCADAVDPRGPGRKLAARRKGFDREFAEMRAHLTELARTGNPGELARTAESAACWLAEVAATEPDISVPADLVALTARHRPPAA